MRTRAKVVIDSDNKIANEVFDVQSIIDQTLGELADRNAAVALVVDLIVAAMDPPAQSQRQGCDRSG